MYTFVRMNEVPPVFWANVQTSANPSLGTIALKPLCDSALYRGELICMKSMESVQDDLVSTFLALGDEFNQYSYLIDLSAKLPPMPETAKNDDSLVRNCQSDVWMQIDKDADSRIHLAADSDAFILRGVLYTVYLIFENRSPSEIESFSFEFIDRTALRNVFSSSRRSGITGIIALIQKTAQEE